MRNGPFKLHVDITFGDQSVVLRRSGNSQLVVANVLGSEVDPVTGGKTVWLDRKVHRVGESQFVEGDAAWLVSGAISTVLRKH
jgi:hypothetical protein